RVVPERLMEPSEQCGLAVAAASLADNQHVIVRHVAGGGLSESDLHPIEYVGGQAGEGCCPVSMLGVGPVRRFGDLGKPQVWRVRQQVPGAQVHNAIGGVE